MLKTSKTVENNSLTKTNKYANRKKRISDVLEIYDGSVRIFKTTNSGDVYQMSMYVKDEKRYVRKSLKTRDKEIAIQIAKKEFIFYEAKLQMVKNYFH